MSVGAPYYHHHSMMVPMFQYLPNVMYPNYMSPAVYPSQGKNNCMIILVLFTTRVLFYSSSYGHGLSPTSVTLAIG